MKMHMIYANNLDDVAAQLAAHIKLAEDGATLTDEQRELYGVGFRAGVAILHELSLDAAGQGLHQWKNLMACVAVQVVDWDLPFITSYRETDFTDTMQ